MEVHLGAYTADAIGASNAYSTRKAIYLYGFSDKDSTNVSEIAWKNVYKHLPCVDNIEPGAFNNLTNLTAISVECTDDYLYKDILPFSFMDILWQEKSSYLLLICCPQKYFSVDTHDRYPGMPYTTRIPVALGDYSFYNVQFKNVAPSWTELGLCQIIFKGKQLAQVHHIGNCVFAKTNLNHFTIWPELSSIGMYAFMNCSQLQAVDFVESEEKFGLSRISRGTFYNCSALETVRLPEGVVYIGSDAFTNCTSLKEVYIPSTLSCICKDAFKNCNDVKLIIPENSQLKHIGIEEHIYLAGEPNLEIDSSRHSDMQLEYFRNNYSIQRIADVAATGCNLNFIGLNALVKLPKVIQNLMEEPLS